MEKFRYEDGAYYYNDNLILNIKENDSDTKIIKVANYIDNYSLFLNEVNKIKSISLDENCLKIIFLSILKKYIEDSKKLNIMEIGCDYGQLSFVLRDFLNALDDNEINLYCLTDEMSMQEMNSWSEFVKLLDKTDTISKIIGTYNKMKIFDNSFDVVIINGMTKFIEPEEVIDYASRVVKEDNGIIICISEKQWLLSDFIQIKYNRAIIYDIGDNKQVIVCNSKDRSNI